MPCSSCEARDWVEKTQTEMIMKNKIPRYKRKSFLKKIYNKKHKHIIF